MQISGIDALLTGIFEEPLYVMPGVPATLGLVMIQGLNHEPSQGAVPLEERGQRYGVIKKIRRALTHQSALICSSEEAALIKKACSAGLSVWCYGLVCDAIDNLGEKTDVSEAKGS